MDTMEMMEQVRPFMYVAVSGEQVCQKPGVVWIDSEEGKARYLCMHEITPEKLRVDVTAMWEECGKSHHLFLHKEGSNVHVFKCGREVVEREMMDLQQKQNESNENE